MSADYEPMPCGPEVAGARAEVFRRARLLWHQRLGVDAGDASAAADFARSVDALAVAAWGEPRPVGEASTVGVAWW